MLYISYPTWLKPEIISGLPIRWYGLMYLFGFATCYFFTIHQLKKDPKTAAIAPHISSLFFWGIVGLLIGARAVSEIVYSGNAGILLRPWLMFWPFDSAMNFIGIQGMSYHGGLIGGAVGAILYCVIARIPAMKISDIIVIGASLGYGFGRLGNFANAELYGRVTTAPIGVLFPQAELLPYGDARVQAVADKLSIAPDEFGLVNLPRHPSQLYEAFSESLVTFVILYFLYRYIKDKRAYMPGMFIPLYVLCYSVARFISEYFRQPDAGLDFVLSFSGVSNPRWLLVTPWNFTTGQVFSGVLILLSLAALGLMYLHKKTKKSLPLSKPDSA